MPSSKTTRFEIPITYRCDRTCQWCDRLIGIIPWKDSDVTLDDVRKAGVLVKSYELKITLLKVTGGEPTLHPHLAQICRMLADWTIGERMVRISTNKTRREFPGIAGIGLRRSPVKTFGGSKIRTEGIHQPNFLSPVDLRLESSCVARCRLMQRCGLVFDAFGFTFCHYAGPVGRLLGIDPYGPEPVTKRNKEICRHCIHSLNKPTCRRLWLAVEKGELEHPSKTYREAMKREPITLTRFRDR